MSGKLARWRRYVAARRRLWITMPRRTPSKVALLPLEDGIAQVGCRGLLCYESTDRNGPDEARLGLAENERYADSHETRRPLRPAESVPTPASRWKKSRSRVASSWPIELQLGVHIHVGRGPRRRADSPASDSVRAVRAFRAARSAGSRRDDLRPRHASFGERLRRLNELAGNDRAGAQS